MGVPANDAEQPRCSQCNAVAFDASRRGSLQLNDGWERVFTIIGCPDCQKVCYDNIIFQVGETDIDDIARQQREYWLSESAKKSASSIATYATIFESPAYRNVTSEIGRKLAEIDHVIVHDYLGNAAGTEPNSAILYSPSFAMYARPYGEYLDAAGLTIENIQPSIACHWDGRSWGVLTASRTAE